jgi:RNA polymerase sigma-70 factor (ECF subfamily)
VGRDDPAHGSPLDGTEDTLLVAAVVRGEPQAWPAFYARFERLMRACVRRTLRWYGVRPTDSDLEDLLSAACLNLVKDDYRKLRTFDPERGYRLSSWVGLIATNTTIDALRRRGPDHVSVDDPGGSVPVVADEAPSPFEELARREEVRTLGAAVEALSPADRLFLEYYFEHELEPSVIAKRMGISVATVYSRKNKIRAKLAALVERLSGAPAVGTAAGDKGAGPGEGGGSRRVRRIR